MTKVIYRTSHKNSREKTMRGLFPAIIFIVYKMCKLFAFQQFVGACESNVDVAAYVF